MQHAGLAAVIRIVVDRKEGVASKFSITESICFFQPLMSLNALLDKAAAKIDALRAQLTSPSSSSADLTAISANFAVLNASLRDAADLAKRELVPDLRDRYQERVRGMRRQYDDLKVAQHGTSFKVQLDALKAALAESARRELLGSATRDFGMLYSSPTDYLQQEQGRVTGIGDRLDEMIQAGARAIDSLRSQRAMIKGVQRRVLDGISGIGSGAELLRMARSRSKRDRIIFWGGVALLVLTFWYFLWYRR